MADVISYVVRITDQSKAGLASATKGAESFTKASDGATQSAAGLTKGIGLTKASVVGLAASLGAAALGGAVVDLGRNFRDLAQEVADYRNDITDASTRSGAAADTLSGLRLAAEGSGLSFGSLTSGLDQFGARIAQASKGSNDTARAFADLGVDVKDADGNLRNLDDILGETLSSLSGLEAGGERSAAAMQVLGRSGGRFLQALSGSDLEDFVELAREFGVDVGPEAAKSAGEWQRATAELDLVVRGLKASLIDTFGGGADAIFAATDAIVFFRAKLGALADASPALIGVVEAAADSLGEALSTNLDRIQARAEAVGIIIGSLASSIQDVATTLSNAIAAGDAIGFASAAASIGDAIASGLSDGFDTARQRIERADTAFGDAARARDANLAAVPAVFSAVSAGAQATGVEALLNLRQRRAAILAGGARGSGFGGDGDGGGSGSGSSVDSAVANASRVFASGFEEDRRRLSEVLAEGAANLADQQSATAAEAAANRRALLQGVQGGIRSSQRLLSGDLGGSLSALGEATGRAGLGVGGAVVGGLQFIGERGAKGIEETLEGVRDSLIVALEALPELIGNVLPRFAVSLVAELIPALIASAPDLFRALIIELPQAIGDAILDALGVGQENRERIREGAGVVDAVATVFGGGGSANPNDIGQAFGVIGDALSGRGRRSTNAGRTAASAADSGRASFTRTEDRLGLVASARPSRAGQPATTDDPFQLMSKQFQRTFGRYGRDTSSVLKET